MFIELDDVMFGLSNHVGIKLRETTSEVRGCCSSINLSFLNKKFQVSNPAWCSGLSVDILVVG
jgi:hypothetical protein